MDPYGRIENEENGSLPGSASQAKKFVSGNYPTAKQKYTSCRWSLCFLLICGFGLVQFMVSSMAFAVVCMTRPTIPGKINRTVYHFNTTANGYKNASSLKLKLDAEFNYSSESQGLLLSSVFYAGLISPIMGSFTSRKIGPKRVILLSMLTGGIVMMLLPMAARTHLHLAMLCQIVIGLSVNAVPPVSFDFWLNWAPHEEKAQLVAYCFSGPNIGHIIVLVVSGYLCLIPVDNGWPFIFYGFGSCTILWCIAWQLIVHETPEGHPRITDKEKAYITANRSTPSDSHKKPNIPWKNIALTKGVWAFFLIEFFHGWNSSVLGSYLPSYMASVLKFDIQQNGVLSSLPYVTRVLGAILCAYLSVRLLKVLSVTHTRKLIQSGGFLVAAGLSVALCYLEEGQEYIAVAIFMISTPFQVVTHSSGYVTPFDMAPQFASIIKSMGIAFSLTAMMISPVAVSYIVRERTREQWSNVFYMSAGVYAFAAIFFLFFGSGQLQPWANNPSSDTEIPTSTKKEKINIAYISDSDEVTKM